MQDNKERVNIFFACDDAYVPFMAVVLSSIEENRDRSRSYDFYLLHTGIAEENISKIQDSFDKDDFRIRFFDISDKASQISERLHTRDYYSKSTYYRLLIPKLFPELKKALYLDCDLVVLGDISRLYDTELGDNLAAAVPDGAVQSIEPFREYVEKRLEVSPSEYFNAGVLLMNLEKMRKIGFEELFVELISAVKFDVAQDQDYLNTICHGKIVYIDEGWNRMPLCARRRGEVVNIVHFNLDNKPWQKEGVPFSEEYRHYVEVSHFSEEIAKIEEGYSDEDRQRSVLDTERLVRTALAEAEDGAENARIHKKVDEILGKADL